MHDSKALWVCFLAPGEVWIRKLSVPGRLAYERPAGQGFFPFRFIFVPRVPAITTHQKLVEFVGDKQNMYGT